MPQCSGVTRQGRRCRHTVSTAGTTCGQCLGPSTGSRLAVASPTPPPARATVSTTAGSVLAALDDINPLLVPDEYAAREVDLGDACVYCGQDTSYGSRRFVNRTSTDTTGQDMSEETLRLYQGFDIGPHTRVEGYGCAGCMARPCDRCGTTIPLDEDEYGDDGAVCCRTCITAQELVNRRTEHGQYDDSAAPVTVRITNVYDGEEHVTDVRMPGPPVGMDVDEWFEDYVYELTGTGRAAGSYESSGYFAEVIDADDQELRGQQAEWGV